MTDPHAVRRVLVALGLAAEPPPRRPVPAAGPTAPRSPPPPGVVHKLRNLERKAPKHALAEIRADFHRIVYAESVAAARIAYTAFERKWTPRCPGVVRSLQEGGDELLTFFAFFLRQVYAPSGA